MKRLALILFLLFATPAFGEAILNPDSVTVNEQQLVQLQYWDKEGASAVDTYPVERPDGWVTKTDSPYYNGSVADLGQIALYDDMRKNKVKRYPGYKDGDWRGKDWDDLSRYRKMIQHLTNEDSVTQVGWRIKLRFQADVDIDEHFNWKPSPAGFGGDIIAVFSEGRIEVNTKYLFGHIEAGSLRQDSSPPQLWLDLFVPKSQEAAFNTFLLELEEWNNAPNLAVSQDGGVTVYSR